MTIDVSLDNGSPYPFGVDGDKVAIALEELVKAIRDHQTIPTKYEVTFSNVADNYLETRIMVGLVSSVEKGL